MVDPREPLREPGERAVRHLRTERSDPRLEAALRRPLDEDERSWADRIEQLRARVQGSDQRIPDKDDGRDTVGVVAKRASKRPVDAELLLKVVRDFRPTFGVELGTCVGISAAYQAAAMALNGRGRLVSIERYGTLADVARSNIDELGLDHIVDVRNGTFRGLLGPALSEGPAEYGFIDGHHKEAPTMAYFETFIRAASGEAVLVVDDINWSDEMVRAWERIRNDDRCTGAMSNGYMGFCVVTPS